MRITSGDPKARLNNMALHTITQRLAQSARKFPDRIAFSSETASITYTDLEQSTFRVGTYLARLLPARTPVGILMARDVPAVQAMLGAIQANLIASPLDPSMPAERMMKIFDTLQPGCLLVDDTADALVADLKDQYDCPVIRIADALACPEDPDLLLDRRRYTSELDPVIIFYTSGSTGIPKGVVHNHRSILNYTIRASDWTEVVNPDQIYGSQSPFFYAHAINDIFIAIYQGCTVYIIPDRLFKFPQALLDYMNEKKITTIVMTPLNYIYIADSGVLTPGSLPYLQSVYFSGEASPWTTLQAWWNAAPNAGLYTFYGSTENCYNSFYEMVEEDIQPGAIAPVGPLSVGVRMLLLDEDGKEVAPGEIGEIYTASPWLSVGYYHNPQLTQNTYLRDPLGCGWDVTFYRTGDLGRFDERGYLWLHGRKDTQIKHRGYRMDLGEVEAALRAVEGWQNGCCLFSEDEDLLYCFWVGPLTEADLRGAVKTKLEKYMIPNVWVHLDELPRTATDKVNRMALKETWFGKAAPTS